MLGKNLFSISLSRLQNSYIHNDLWFVIYNSFYI